MAGNAKRVGIICLLLVLLPAIGLFGQSRTELEKKRKRLNASIKLTSKMLEEAKQNTRSAYDQFLTLQAQIKNREALIRTINAEIDYLDQAIARSEDLIASMESDIDMIKAEYAEMVREAYKLKTTQNKFSFLFSSETFNEAILRWRYLKRYDEYRRKQAQLIKNTQTALANKITKYEERKDEKQELKDIEIQQQQLLNSELSGQDQLLAKLKTESKQLSSSLAQKEKERDKLLKRIQNAIRDDIAARKKKETPKLDNSKATSNSKDPVIASVDMPLARKFRQQKGRLPWPVRAGFISGKFGDQPHPLNAQLTIRNTGIDIRTDENANVYAVFDGEVVQVFHDPVLKYAVMVKHGNYYTVYANIRTKEVSKGEAIKSGQLIGQVDTRQGKSELHFEVWKDKDYQNPTTWIARK